ncbi:MAG: hypothetical protein U9Q81_04145 [Pseudomonadota bacterium]|nr:hypothetical protein [Pseudomonadota bacterium]
MVDLTPSPCDPISLENFSGLSAQVAQQDFYAKIFVLNLAAILSWVAQAIAKRLYQTRRRSYRVNFANALSKMKDNLIQLFLFDSPLQLLTALVLAMAASAPKPSDPIAPTRGKSNPRSSTASIPTTKGADRG